MAVNRKNKATSLPRKMAIYIRVSTDRQVNEGMSLEKQRQDGIAEATANGYSYEVYEDGGVSGKYDSSERNALRKLVHDIDSNEIGAVWIARVDRMGRNDINTLMLFKKIEDKKLEFFSDGKLQDLTDPTDKLILSIQSTLAEWERQTIAERVRKAMHHKIKGGVSAMRIPALGYYSIEKILTVDEEEAEVVKYIYKLYLQNISCKKIADRLNEEKVKTKFERLKDRGFPASKYQSTIVRHGKQIKIESFRWREKTINDILKNSLYSGKRNYGGEVYDAPAIITEDTFNAVQNKMSSKVSTGKNTTHFYLLKDLVSCNKCGSRMYGVVKESSKDYYYMCSSKRYKDEFCGNPSINIGYLDNLVISSLSNLDEELDNYFTNNFNKGDIAVQQQKLDSLQSEYESVKTIYERAYRLFIEKEIGTEQMLEEYKNAVEIAKRTIDATLASNGEEYNAYRNRNAIIEHVENIITAVMSTDDREKRKAILSTIVSNVLVSELSNNIRNVRVTYTFHALEDYVIIDNVFEIQHSSNFTFAKKTTNLKHFSVSVNVTDTDVHVLSADAVS